jgi:hypothetical protein
VNNQNGFTHYVVLSLAFVLVITGCFLFLRLNNNNIFESEVSPEDVPVASQSPNPTVRPSGMPPAPHSDARVTPTTAETVKTQITVDPTDWSLPINLTNCYPEEKRIEQTGNESTLTFKESTEKECIFTYTSKEELSEKVCTFPRSLVILDPKNTIFALYCKQSKNITQEGDGQLPKTTLPQ